VRCARDKYVKTKTLETVTEGMKIIIEETLIPFCKNLDPHVWRKNEYWTE